MTTNSLFQQSKKYIPGGVNSPVRAFNSVAGSPVFFKKASGAYLYDINNKEYIDYVGSWGAMILGHAHPSIIKTVQDKAVDGLSFGAPTEIETLMAKKVCELIPSIKKIRMVSSGTEAAMSAIRLARGFTKRDKIIKFEGCYHGHADSLLVKAGSGALTLGEPSSKGVPHDFAKHTITLNYNDTSQIEYVFSKLNEQIAAVIVEPVAGNMNCVPGKQEFLQKLRDICDKYHSILIFDEVMSGFRVALGGAQSLYRINPDLTILGKVIGGGMPVGAFGGKEDIMNYIAPDGPVYQAGTLSGHPLAMAAGLKTLELISTQDFFQSLEEKTKALTTGLKKAAIANNIPLTTNHMGGMFGFFFTHQTTIDSFDKVMNCDLELFNNFFHYMLKEHIYFAPSAFEAGFMSEAHNEQIINKTIDIADKVFSTLKS